MQYFYFLIFFLFIVMHQFTPTNSLYDKIYLAINLTLILIVVRSEEEALTAGFWPHP